MTTDHRKNEHSRLDFAQSVLRRLDEARTSIAFFTRLPVLATGLWSFPDNNAISADDHGKLFAGSFWAAPLAGLAVGLVALAIIGVGSFLVPSLPTSIWAIIALSVMAGVTGGLHEDGLADLADACGGGTKDRRLEIMKDSRIGSFGVVSLVLWFLMAFVCLEAIFERKGIWVILFAAIASRGTLPLAIWLMPSASSSGLGKSAKAETPIWLAIIALAGGLLPAMIFGHWAAVFGLLIGQALTLALSQRLIGGATGDSFGAAQKMGELGFYLGVLATLPQVTVPL